MANLKNITELPVANSASGLNLIVNDNGTAKQIAASAVGAQADWNVTDVTNPAFIVNKPTIPAAQVQADWNESNENNVAFIKNKPDINSVYVIDSEAYTYGDDALDAILKGKQVLIKVPNKVGGTLFSNFMPVLQYQLPNENNNYLILIYLKDGIAENIMTAMQTGSFDGVYGTIQMMLSETYTECPLKVSPVK